MAVGKHQPVGLPRMAAAHTLDIFIRWGKFPARRHFAKLIAVVDSCLVVHFMRMQRGVNEIAVLL